jgi:hypothetical protein
MTSIQGSSASLHPYDAWGLTSQPSPKQSLGCAVSLAVNRRRTTNDGQNARDSVLYKYVYLHSVPPYGAGCAVLQYATGWCSIASRCQAGLTIICRYRMQRVVLLHSNVNVADGPGPSLPTVLYIRSMDGGWKFDPRWRGQSKITWISRRMATSTFTAGLDLAWWIWRSDGSS